MVVTHFNTIRETTANGSVSCRFLVMCIGGGVSLVAVADLLGGLSDEGRPVPTRRIGPGHDGPAWPRFRTSKWGNQPPTSSAARRVRRRAEYSHDAAREFGELVDRETGP